MEIEKGILGNAIRTARIENHMSQEELAELVGITPTHLKHLESEHRNPSIDVLFKIAKVLHLSLDSLLFPNKDAHSEICSQLLLLINLCTDNELLVVTDLINSILQHR